MGKAMSGIRSNKDDFFMVCPSPNSMVQAIHALYYLPDNYRLVVLAQVAAQDKTWAEHSDMTDRVRFEDQDELSDPTSRFSSAHAIISDTEPHIFNTVPLVLLSEANEESLESTGANRFAVSTDSPEALASAILKIAKTPRSLSPEIHQYA